MAESTLELPSDFEHETPGLGIQRDARVVALHYSEVKFISLIYTNR